MLKRALLGKRIYIEQVAEIIITIKISFKIWWEQQWALKTTLLRKWIDS